MEISKFQDRNQVSRVSAGLRAPGSLVRWPIIGLAMFVLGSLMFGALAFNLQNQGPLLQWDVPIANSLHAVALRSPNYVKDFMIAGFYVGKQLISVIGLILGLYYLYKRFWRELAMVIVGFGGAGFLWLTLSTYFNRPRPMLDPPIWMVIPGGGFPSGHTLSAVVCYGLLAYLFASHIHSRFWKWLVVIGAVAIVLFIGFSRLFLGEHFLSDVLAGYGLGIAWSGLSYTSIEVVFNKWRNKYVKKG